MTAPSRPLAGPPTAGRIASLAVWHWIDNTAAGFVAFLLLAHPPPTRREAPAEVAPVMRGLATSLSLAKCGAALPDMGPRLFVQRAGVLMRLDGCAYLLRVPTSTLWSDFACAGGTVVVTVGLDPLAAHSPRDTVEAYLANSARQGRLLMGKARAQARPQPWSQGREGRDEH